MSGITKAIEVLNVAKQEAIKEVALDDPNRNFALIIESHINNLTNRLSFAIGRNANSGNENKVQFKPVTNFMGEKVKLVKPVEKEDLTPDEQMKHDFREKVDKLFKEFRTITPEGILNSYTLPEDVIVVRAVAKKAGVPDYDTKEMSLQFIESISKALDAKDKAVKEDDEIEKKLQAELGNSDDTGKAVKEDEKNQTNKKRGQ